MIATSRYEYVPTLIAGASMRGLGMAFRKGKDVVILESTIGVGNEFIRSYKYSELPYKATSPKAIELQKEAENRNVMDIDGRLHLPGLLHLLMKQVYDASLDVRMMASIIEVNKRGKQFEVIYYDSTGFNTIVTDRVVDTTPYCTTKPGQFKPDRKSLNLMIHSRSEDLADDLRRNFSIRQGRFASEITLEYPVQLDEGWMSAKNKLFQFWMTRPDPLAAYTFVTHADVFDMEYSCNRQIVEEGWEWLPSAYYENALESFEHGWQEGDAQ